MAQLLSPQCGLYTVDGDISLAEALDWNTITARLAATAPLWPIGTQHGPAVPRKQQRVTSASYQATAHIPGWWVIGVSRVKDSGWDNTRQK